MQEVQIQDQKQLTRAERRAQAKLAKQIARANKKQEQAANASFDVTRTDPDSFY